MNAMITNCTENANIMTFVKDFTQEFLPKDVYLDKKVQIL